MLASVEDAFKYLGNTFKDLYENFKKMFDAKPFKLAKFSISSFANGFQTAADKIKSSVDIKSLVQGKEMSLDVGTKDKWTAGGGYAVVKLGEETLIKPVVDAFCRLIHHLLDPIKKAINSLTKIITGVIPVWLVKIAAFGSVGALATLLFSAFTIGVGWGYTYGVTTDAFEIGMALQLKDMTVGSTGCYLGGSSGITGGEVGGSGFGISVSAFKEFGNIAGDSATLGIEGDVCKLLGLGCELAISGSIVWDNTDWHNGNSVALQTFKTCLGKDAAYANEIENLQIKHKMTVNMVQTLSKQELERNILEEAYNFFKKGFGTLKNCIVAIFDLWIGLVLDVTAGVAVGAPVKGTFTLDYTYCKEHK